MEKREGCAWWEHVASSEDLLGDSAAPAGREGAGRRERRVPRGRSPIGQAGWGGGVSLDR